MHGIRTFIYPVKDLDRAKPLYTALLGVEPYVDQPYYAGYQVGDQEVGLDPNGHASGMAGPIGYWHVGDINQTIEALAAAGGQPQGPVRDVGGGKLIGTVADADGNVIGLIQEASVR